MKNNQEQLLLKNQVCFPMYASSRKLTKMYQPYLSELDLTYPQYLVMLVLWEENSCSISRIGELLRLQTNTLTPLIKTMVQKDFISKVRSKEDERIVTISLTKKGEILNQKAAHIPMAMANETNLSLEELVQLKQLMDKFLCDTRV